MSIELITLISMVFLLGLLAVGLPFAFVLGSMAVIVTLLVLGPGGFPLIVSRVFSQLTNFILAAIPLFIFMALMMRHSGIIEDLYKAIYVWAGRLRGGLAMGTLVIAAIMAAMIGVIGAAVVTLGLIALPSMLSRNYDKKLVLGTVAAGGSLGTLIPPSVVFIVYGSVAGQSVGKLFAGGFLPGLLLATLFILYIGVRCFLQPQLGPPLPVEESMIPLRQKVSYVTTLIAPGFLIAVVLGSIFLGVATPTEAAALGSVGAVVCAVIRRQFSWRALTSALYETLRVSSMVFWVIIAGSAFAGIYTLAGGARFVEELVVGLPLGPWGIFVLVQVLLFFMGMVFDWIVIIMIAGPIIFPIMGALGFDLVWFGVIFCMNMQIAYLTPPMGPALIFLKGAVPPEITMGDIIRSVWPFVILQAIGLVLVVIFPQIALWLPNIMIR